MISKERFFNTTKLYPWRKDIIWCSEYCKDKWPGEMEHIIKIANDVVQQIYLFDLPWDMERTFEPVTFAGEIMWEYKPGPDMEFTYQFNRHSFFSCLGQAYILTKDEKYAKAFVTQILHWIDNNPLTEQTKKTTWRSLEAGIRCANWIKALGYFKDSIYFTNEVFEIIFKSLQTHGEYIKKEDSLFKLKSNWGIIENIGLLYLKAGLLQESNESCQAIVEYLLQEAKIQIMDDGVQWEQSPMYHNEVLHCYLELLRISKIYELSLPEELTDRIKKLSYVNLFWSKPNHCQFATGDSDETDLRDMLCHSSYLLKDGALKFGAFQDMSWDGVWDFGKEGVLEYADIPREQPSHTHYALCESGNYYLRSHWGEDGNVLHFRNGSLGNGHGHNDKLHIDLVIKGEDVLVDSGRYSYVYDEKRIWLKSSPAHNTVTVDGKDYMDYVDSWQVNGLAPYFKNGWKVKGDYAVVQGGHGGYLSLKDGVYVNRKVIAIENRIFILVDEFYSGGRHEYAQYFHFNDLGKVHIQENEITYQGKEVCAIMKVLSDGVRIDREKTLLSKQYNQYFLKDTITIKKDSDEFTPMITVIGEEYEASKSPIYKGDGISVLEEKYASGVNIKTNDSNYLILIAHQDIADPCDLLLSKNINGDICKGMGNIIIFKDQETIGGTVFN